MARVRPEAFHAVSVGTTSVKSGVLRSPSTKPVFQRCPIVELVGEFAWFVQPSCDLIADTN